MFYNIIISLLTLLFNLWKKNTPIYCDVSFFFGGGKYEYYETYRKIYRVVKEKIERKKNILSHQFFH